MLKQKHGRTYHALPFNLGCKAIAARYHFCSAVHAGHQSPFQCAYWCIYKFLDVVLIEHDWTYQSNGDFGASNKRFDVVLNGLGV